MKGQYIVLKEIIAFAIGVSMVIGLATLMSTLLVPAVKDYVLSREMENLLLYVDLNLMEAYTSTKGISSVNMSYHLSMPDDLLGSLYRINFVGRELCLTPEKYPSEECLESSIPSDVSLSGSYVSGTDMLISVNKDGGFSISISNPV